MENKKSWIRSLFGYKSATQTNTPSEAILHPAGNASIGASFKPSPSVQSAMPNVPTTPKRFAEDSGHTIWKAGDLMDQESEVRGFLGEGGMGTVYKVFYRPWKKELAVKCPRPELFAQADDKAHFIQEAETLDSTGNLSSYC